MAVVEANRRLAVILAADIVGYSRLMALDEDGTVQTLATYQEVIAALVAEHAGRIFNLAGDGIMAEFASAVQAVRCAVAIQRMAARRNGDLAEDRRVAFRIGLNLGDVVARGGDLLGDGVNVAARLQALAEPEQICISAAVREQIEGKVAFGCASRGEHSLKHIARPVHVYAVDWALQAPVPVAELRKGALPLPDRPSIAVLPFANMSQDQEQEYFADGLSEDLITALAKYRWFFVIARNSSFGYKGRSVPVQQVGRELGVRYVVEGSTRRSGNRVRVTAQLVEADTGHHLWADHYDRELQDLFALQDEIVGRVVGAIEPGMMRSETQRARRKTALRMDAWDLVFRGQWHFHHITREHHAEARACFRHAIAADPSLAEGYIWLVRCLNGTMFFGWSDDRAADLAEETEAVGMAMRLSDGDPYALYARAIHCNSVGQAERAIASAQLAIDRSPSFALAHFILGVSRVFAGRAGQAIEPLQRGFRLNPNDPQAFVWMQYVALAHFLLGEHADAAERAAETVAMRPDYHVGYAILACSLAAMGSTAEARRAVDEMLRVQPNPHALDDLMARFADPADPARLRDGLRRARWMEAP